MREVEREEELDRREGGKKRGFRGNINLFHYQTYSKLHRIRPIYIGFQKILFYVRKYYKSY